MNDRARLFNTRCQITYICQSENFHDILKKHKKHKQVQYCRQSWLKDLMHLCADLLQLYTILIELYILNVTDVYQEMTVACLNA